MVLCRMKKRKLVIVSATLAVIMISEITESVVIVTILLFSTSNIIQIRSL